MDQNNVLEAKADLLAQQMARGFTLMEKSFEAVAVDISELKSEMAEVRDHLSGVHGKIENLTPEVRETNSRLTLVERRLEAVEEGLDEVKGFSKDIDYALERTVIIERHLGIESVESAEVV